LLACFNCAAVCAQEKSTAEVAYLGAVSSLTHYQGNESSTQKMHKILATQDQLDQLFAETGNDAVKYLRDANEALGTAIFKKAGADDMNFGQETRLASRAERDQRHRFALTLRQEAFESEQIGAANLIKVIFFVMPQLNPIEGADETKVDQSEKSAPGAMIDLLQNLQKCQRLLNVLEEGRVNFDREIEQIETIIIDISAPERGNGRALAQKTVDLAHKTRSLYLFGQDTIDNRSGPQAWLLEQAIPSLRLEIEMVTQNIDQARRSLRR